MVGAEGTFFPFHPFQAAGKSLCALMVLIINIIFHQTCPCCGESNLMLFNIIYNIACYCLATYPYK